MPNVPSQPLEWTEENFSKVVADLYREAAVDGTLHRRLLSNPLDVLSTRINVPENYRGGLFARERNQDAIMLYVPPLGQTSAALPEGTTEADPKPDFEPICTIWTMW